MMIQQIRFATCGSVLERVYSKFLTMLQCANANTFSIPVNSAGSPSLKPVCSCCSWLTAVTYALPNKKVEKTSPCTKAILVLQITLVLVFILFLERNFYSYMVLVFPVIIILVFI